MHQWGMLMCYMHVCVNVNETPHEHATLISASDLHSFATLVVQECKLLDLAQTRRGCGFITRWILDIFLVCNMHR